MTNLLDLPPERDLPADRAQVRRTMLEEYVRTHSEGTTVSRHGNRWMIGLLAAVLVVVTGAATYRALAPAKITDQVRCYTVASLRGGDDSFFGTTAAQATAADGTKHESPPIEVCALLWRAGVLQEGRKQVTGPGPSAGTYPVPPLVACTLDNGIAAVFPGGDRTCTELGLPRLTP